MYDVITRYIIPLMSFSRFFFLGAFFSEHPEKMFLAVYPWFLSVGHHPVRQHPDPRNLSERLKGPYVFSFYFPALFFLFFFFGEVDWFPRFFPFGERLGVFLSELGES